MHLYNAWLPPPVAEESRREKESFTAVVKAVKAAYSADDPESVFATLKWVPVIDLFLKAKSDVLSEDVTTVVEIGLELFKISENKLHAQVRWANLMIKVLNKYRKKLSLRIPWRPLYDSLMNTHFRRNTGPEGWRVRQRHFSTVTSLVRSSRRFFPPGSASEIWSEFRSLLENPWHNAAFEGAGFVCLFLPTNLDNQDFYSEEWIKSCLKHWDSVPNSQFWNIQWASVTARVVKNVKSVSWEFVFPDLFNKYLNMFEVPIANGSGSNPFSVDVSRNTRFLFAHKAMTPTQAIAKAIVYLLRPDGPAHEYFDKLVNLLEQYYHPSNGGRWTYSLERFLYYLVTTFQMRLQNEQKSRVDGLCNECFLEQPDRISFVKTVLKLIDRGQYSKNEHLSETVATATSILSYMEPSLVLPFLASRFHMALETTTATHQLKTALMSVAFAGRSLFLTAATSLTSMSENVESVSYTDLLMVSLSNALLGMDANDPPKTLATMQLIGSLFSNMAVLEDTTSELSFLPDFRFSEWLDEFFCRLFALLQHLEPSSALGEGVNSPSSAGTFLVEDGPYYFCMLEILFGRLSKTLYKQALTKISKFIKTNILPGAIAEVGLLCCACISSNPEEAVVHIVEPILNSIISSLRGTPVTGYVGSGTSESSGLNKKKATISPALETSIEYQLKVLSVSINYGGSALLRYKDDFKEVIFSAFNSTSWKVNGAGDHVLRSLLGSLILYYPIDQYKCISHHSSASSLEEWISAKDFSDEETSVGPKWHIPCDEEVQFANELLELHLNGALDDLQRICQSKLDSESGDVKEHMKVTLLRVDSSLQGVLSCLPDFRQSSKNGMVEDTSHLPFLIAGATGSVVGSTELREKAANIIHSACKCLLEEEKYDDSILFLLVIRIMDTLGNYGSSEYEEWSNHRQAWKLESAAIIEPPINFIVSSHSKGKRRPRWSLIDKTYMHSTWRSSQSSYHLFRTSGKISPSGHMLILMNDLLDLSLHSYETVRFLAGKSLVKMLKRWPSSISDCVYSLTRNLKTPSSPEYTVLGSCAVLASQTVLKCLTMDGKALSSFLLGILSSSHHESLKSQKAITELFVKYNMYFEGVSRSVLVASGTHSDGTDFSNLVSQISSMSFGSSNLHWRYNLMANRVLLLLAMASASEPHSSSKILTETSGHFLKNLKSQLPQTRILSISALNTLLKESPYRVSIEGTTSSGTEQEIAKSSLEGALSSIFQEEGFFSDILQSLSNVHVINETDGAARGHQGSSSIQSMADKSITHFFFDFSSSWPRTPSWISLLGSDTFYSSFARIFKRLIQECGVSVLLALRDALVEFITADERSKQCVAAEAFAGVLHSDVVGISEAWDSWMMIQLQNVIQSQSVESIPEWASCIRYAVTGKGRYGTRVPLLRERIMKCLLTPLSQMATSAVVAKRYIFLTAAFIEVSPQTMPVDEKQLHYRLLEELLSNMSHSSAQVRESIGVALCVLCSNIRLNESFSPSNSGKGADACNTFNAGSWDTYLVKKASELVLNIQKIGVSDFMEVQTEKMSDNGKSHDQSREDVNWMETMFHFAISSLKSGRSSVLLDVLVGLMYPIISLRETSNKDLSTLAKAAFELLKWRVFQGTNLQKAVSLILSAADDSNWRIRSTTLTFWRTFMFRHTFILPNVDEKHIWCNVEKLLMDNQIEVREHAAAVLAGLMKGGDVNLSEDFRNRAFKEASIIQKKRQKRPRTSLSVASIHGPVLALTACVLSVPYDMPSWLPELVTLLALFASEPSPVKSTVTKAVAEFRRTHADTWNFQKESFTEDQLEVLVDTSSSSSYFA